MESNYIVATPNNHFAKALESMAWENLNAADYAFNKPFYLRFKDKQVFVSDGVLRIVPKRRIVAFGSWQGKQVVAKIFFDAKQAKRHMEKDLAGISLLQKNKIPTPALLHDAVSEDKRIYVLIYERILYSKNLEEIWQEKQSVEDILLLLKSVVIEIATQHVLGLMQHDLHLKNFLLDDKTIFTLDGAQIEESAFLLPKQASMNNLALFLSQLGADAEGYQEILFKHYAKARGWSLKNEDFIDLSLMIKKWNDVRWQKYEKKIYRNSSVFSCIQDWHGFGIYDRQYQAPEFMHFLAHPEQVFSASASASSSSSLSSSSSSSPSSVTTEVLKAGNSATVIKVTLDGRDYVIKRYNIKNTWHWLRRCLRPTRAASSWRLAQKLCLFNILTAKPVAFLEKRFLGLRSVSYYVTEYVQGGHAGEYFSQSIAYDQATEQMVRRISCLLKKLEKIELTHGDLKITNILIDSEKQPVLIDLDGTSEHFSLSALRKAWKKERARFLKNFNSNPILRKMFENELIKKK